MASILIHTADESVTLTAQTVKRLLDRGDGDAALLYLALLRHHGTVQPRSLAGELRWEKSRIEAAEQGSGTCGCWRLQRRRSRSADEKPSYQRGMTLPGGWRAKEDFRLLTAGKKAGEAAHHAGCGRSAGISNDIWVCRFT